MWFSSLTHSVGGVFRDFIDVTLGVRIPTKDLTDVTLASDGTDDDDGDDNHDDHDSHDDLA